MLGALAGIGLGLGSAVAGTTGAILSGEYQKSLQESQQTFAKNQSENQIKYNVQQMKDLGYSPSMLFAGNTPSGGGAGSGGMGKAPDFAAPILAAVNTVGNLWMRDKELDNKEKYINMLENKSLNENSAGKTSYMSHNYKSKDLNNVFDDPFDVEI